MLPVGDGRWRCRKTGLIVVEKPTVGLWRVFKSSHGPLNPPLRQGTPDVGWSRFDIEGAATVYGAMHARGAFVESLAPFAPSRLKIAELFDDVPAGQDPVTEDWMELHHMKQTTTAAQWGGGGGIV
jgi:hypothetical protein